MNILILGGDGYLGWPTALYFSKKGYNVTIVDNFIKKKIVFEFGFKPLISPPSLQERVRIWNLNNKTKLKQLLEIY